MKVVFCGTPDWAVPSLRALVASSHAVVGVVTATDKPSGRSGRPVASAVKQMAEELAAGPLLQPETLRSREARDSILRLGADALVVVAYGRILPGRLLDGPPHGAVNLHFSLLPRHRGASPVQHAILAGDAVTGVTTMLMDRGLDTGPVLLQREVGIEPDETTPELGSRLASDGSDLLIETLDRLERGAVHPHPQDDRLATGAPRLSREMGAVRWSWPAARIERMTRAFLPWPPVVATGPRGPLRLTAASAVDRPAPHGCEPGTVLGRAADAVEIACGDGSVLRVREVQPANRKTMGAASALSGGYLVAGERLRDGGAD
ncbi:MAG: methionyl-tRNA formyltransferase [Acidobacteriota bacterium]|nr:methionyl-tRNA formyltransferase [Acidobacteriota bacterium]